jgi:hypothetical protein
MDSMVPTLRPRGKIWSPPEVRTASPGLMRESWVRLPIWIPPPSEPRRIVDLKDLRGVRRSSGKDVADLADDSVGRNHSHVGLETVGGTLVDVENAGLIFAAGSDDLRGDGRGDVMLAEGEELLQAKALGGVLGELGLLEAEARDLLLELLVLLPRVAQVDVVGPSSANAFADAVRDAFGGRDDGDDPGTDDQHLATICLTWTVGIAHLHGEQDDLCEQDDSEHERVLKPDEKGFHLLGDIISDKGQECLMDCGRLGRVFHTLRR